MKISIDNQTRWSTADLRALYRGALRAAGATAGGALVVKSARFVHRNGEFSVGGNCHYGRHGRPGLCTIFLPTPKAKHESAEIRSREARLSPEAREWNPARFRDEVARVMHHEALHGVGAKHRDMTEAQYHCTQKIDWARNLPLNVEAAPERKAATPADRLGHARSMLAKAQTRSKRAATIEKKWARRVKMLERKAST